MIYELFRQSRDNNVIIDPERLAFWQDRYAQYNKLARRNPSRANARFIGTNTDKYYSTLRGFIIASLSVQLRTS